MDNILTLKSMTILLGQKQNDLVFKIHFGSLQLKGKNLRTNLLHNVLCPL